MSVKASPLQISEGVLGDLAPASHHSSMVIARWEAFTGERAEKVRS
mgnify:FL=1